MAHPFEYAVLRVVPRVERGEYMNAGVVLYCSACRFLDARIHLDPERLQAFAPGLNHGEVLSHLEAARKVCAGGPEAGEIGRLPMGQRFGWIVAPRSTVVQPSPVHTGLADDPREALEHLVRAMVHPPDGSSS